MSKVDSTVSLGPDESAEVLDVFNDIASDLHPTSPKLANAMFGVARQRSISRLKGPSRRDSPTLPWRTNSQRSTSSTLGEVKTNGKPLTATPPPRPDSPDIDTILAQTPRPRKSSTSLVTPSRTRSSQSLRRVAKQDENDELLDDRSFASVSDYGNLLEDIDSGPEDGDGSESDSSIDIHTPLPHLMFRDGLLSPRSKLLPQGSSGSAEIENSDKSVSRAQSVLSLASTTGSMTTKSGLFKDPRDTERRRVRHRDGQLLKAGMGLTTGLGWSDSEDEDAPSALTRRLISTTIDRKRNGSITSTRRSSTQLGELSMSRLSSPLPTSRSPMPRKPLSNSGLRSASVSFPTKGPSNPTVGPGSGLRIPRGRAASTANVTSIKSTSSMVTSHSKSSLSLSHSNSSLRSQPIPEAVAFPSEPVSPKTIPVSAPPDVLKMRSRADSAASTATTRSVSSIATPVASLPRRKESMDCLKPGTQMSRVRKDSSLSTSASTSSLASTYSQHSTSTTSSGSVVPRPLRLPQEAALKAPTRTFSHDFGLTSSPPSRIGDDATLKYQRLRTLSNPQSETRAQTVPAQRSLNSSQSLESGVLPPGSPPTLRQRLVPNGARPRPRTGTGMVYRTSSHSYASFHESGSKMRNMSIPAGEGVMPAF